MFNWFLFYKFIAGYIQSLSIQPKLQALEDRPATLVRSNTIDIIEVPLLKLAEVNDEGLFIVAKSKLEGVEILAITESQGTFRITPKNHIYIEKIYVDTLKLFPNREKIYMSFIKDQKLIIKSWSFKRQNVVDISMPGAVQFTKPRLTNAVGETFFVAEEKYVTWPYEGYKTTACRFGLESECFKCIEVTCGGIKEIIGIGDEIFVFNQKAEVFSFNLSGDKRISRGTLNHNGLLKAVIYHGNIYIGCYVRSKCTLFLEKFNRKCNEWIPVNNFNFIDNYF